MTGVLTHALTVVLTAAVIWPAAWYARHRLGPRRVWACARCDQEVVQAEFRRYEDTLAALDFDPKDQP